MIERIKPTHQVYTDYTAEDFNVWKILFNRQMEFINEHASKDFIKAIDAIGFTPERIPDFDDVNQRLSKLTGWKIVTVPCISPPKAFFQHLAKKEFTATCWIRKIAELDYLEEPDMFHDVFAHTPLLTNTDYVTFFQAMGDMAVQHIDNLEIVTMLQRLYWFTIEFGLINEDGENKMYGAGIISSKGETLHALSDRPRKKQFEISEIMAHDFRTDVIQEEYYVIDSFAQLKNAIPQIRAEVQKLQKSSVTEKIPGSRFQNQNTAPLNP